MSGRAKASPTITRNATFSWSMSSHVAHGVEVAIGQEDDGAARVERGQGDPLAGAVHERARGMAAQPRGEIGGDLLGCA